MELRIHRIKNVFLVKIRPMPTKLFIILGIPVSVPARVPYNIGLRVKLFRMSGRSLSRIKINLRNNV